MIESCTVLVGGKIYSWKAYSMAGPSQITEKAHCGIGSLGGRYFPRTDISEAVVLHVGLFEDWDSWAGWISSLELHPDRPPSFPPPRDKPHAVPVVQATFDLVVCDTEGTHSFRYWRVVDNIQSKAWDL